MISPSSFMHEFLEFIQFFWQYVKARFVGFGVRFEKGKDVVVAVLVVRRGKYSQSFLNTSFFLLISAALIGGPAIAENNPFISDYLSTAQATNQAVLETTINSLPVNTTVSQRPRDKVEVYTVKSGETMSSIANRFDVSVDSVKWASGLKNTTIKPGQELKIPPVTGVVHKVVSGETIYSIAKKYKVDAQQIVNWDFNEFTDLDTFGLTPGQTLYVPAGVIEEARPSEPTEGRLSPNIAAGTPGTGSFIWPTSGTITQYPIWYHMALDIANRALPPVIAADAGSVSYAGCLRYGYGCHVIINHNNGYQSLYGHLSSIGVSVGQSVGRGEQIGILGSTGRSTGPHLHFEIRSGGKQLNPLGFLK